MLLYNLFIFSLKMHHLSAMTDNYFLKNLNRYKLIDDLQTMCIDVIPELNFLY